MQDLVTKDFDYTLMECTDADREFLKGKEQSIKSRTAQTVIENGRDLLEAKDRVGHGNFEKWANEALPWSIRQSQRMMQVAESFKSDTVSHLENFQARALYALASNTVPESAREEAIQKAESGEKVTHADAQELIRAHKMIADHEKRIAEYEDNIRKLKSQLPTTDVLQQIAKLQADLIAEKDKGPVEVVKVVEPEDYQKVKQERQDLLAKLQEEQRKPPVEKIVTPPDYEIIKKEKTDLEIARRRLADQVKALKEKHEKELKDQDARALREAAKEIEVKQKQAETITARITRLKDEMESLEKNFGAVATYKDVCNSVKKEMAGIAFRLQDAFEKHPVPEEFVPVIKSIIKDMKSTAIALENFLDPRQQIQ